jgi:hypothetical protein
LVSVAPVVVQKIFAGAESTAGHRRRIFLDRSLSRVMGGTVSVEMVRHSPMASVRSTAAHPRDNRQSILGGFLFHLQSKFCKPPDRNRSGWQTIPTAKAKEVPVK